LWQDGGQQLLTDLGVASLASLTQLASLNLGCCSNFTAVGVTPLASLTALTNLNVQFRKMTEEEIGALAMVLTNLTSLNLYTT
jgi:hypothetical protein